MSVAVVLVQLLLPKEWGWSDGSWNCYFLPVGTNYVCLWSHVGVFIGRL